MGWSGAGRRVLRVPLVACTLAACDASGGERPDHAAGGIDTVVTRAECRSGPCEIRMSHVAALSDSGVEGQLTAMTAGAPDSRRRLIVAGINRIIVYDSAGRLTGTFGRHGQGPGEFQRMLYAFVGTGDSIYAYDHSSARMTVVTPELRFARSIPAPHAPVFALRDGSFIIAQQIRTPENANFPLHRMLADGSIARSFGGSGLTYRPDIRRRIGRGVGPGRDGTVWSVVHGRYVLERHDPISGARLDSIAIRSPWFRESDRSGNDLHDRPEPVLEHVWEDSRGFVWVLGREADPDWRPALTPRDYDGPYDRDATYDWILDVIDPDDGRIVASRRLPTYPRVRHPAYSTITLGPDSTEVTHHVWRLSLALQRPR